MDSATLAAAKKLEFSILKPAHVDGAVHCLAESFMDEPLVRTLGMPYRGMADFLRPRIELTAQDGLSLVALEAGKVVSVALNDNNSSEWVPYPNEEKWNVFLEPILGLLERLHLECDIERQMQADSLSFFHMFMWGTLQEARGKGYLKKLIALSLETAREKGFDAAVVEATSPGSQHACRQFGFTQPNSISYAEVPFLKVLGDARLELYLLRL